MQRPLTRLRLCQVMSGHGLEMTPKPFMTPSESEAEIMKENTDPTGCCCSCHNELDGPYYETSEVCEPARDCTCHHQAPCDYVTVRSAKWNLMSGTLIQGPNCEGCATGNPPPLRVRQPPDGVASGSTEDNVAPAKGCVVS